MEETCKRFLNVLKILPDRLNQPQLFRKILERHRLALSWKPQGYIPLGIHVNSPEHRYGLDYSRWLEGSAFFELYIRMLADTLEVGSDLVPVIPLNHLGPAVLPSMFGCELEIPKGHITRVQDTGPWVRPVLKHIREVDELMVPPLTAGILPAVERLLQSYRANAPDWIYIITPFRLEPFSAAELLRGGGILLDVLDDPERVSRLMDICAETIIRVEKHLRAVAGEPLDRHISNFGINGPGPRLAGDSLVNLSPSIIHDFVVPGIRKIAHAFGRKTYVHFCSVDAHRAEHLYSALAQIEEISAVSSQLGFAYYEEHLAELRGHLAVEAFYGGAFQFVKRHYGSFEKWAQDFVPRFKNESGLVLYFEVASVDDGKRIWETWQCAHKI